MLHFIPVIEGQAVQSKCVERHRKAFRRRGRNAICVVFWRSSDTAAARCDAPPMCSSPSPLMRRKMYIRRTAIQAYFCLSAGKPQVFHVCNVGADNSFPPALRGAARAMRPHSMARLLAGLQQRALTAGAGDELEKSNDRSRHKQDIES